MSLNKKAENAKQLEIKKSVLDWCKEQAETGNELALNWEGGGDSGWAYFTINGEEVDNEYTSYLVDQIYKELDYGSWAGEFNAGGQAIFNSEENAFIGTDEYTEDTRKSVECEILIKVPKELWHNILSVDLDGNQDEETKVEVTFGVTNGFLTDAHHDFEQAISAEIQHEVDLVIDNFIDGGEDYRGVWDNILFQKSDGVEKDNFIEYKISAIDVQTSNSQERGIYLEITEEDVLKD